MNAVAGSSRCSYALLGLPGPRVHRLVCFAPLTICGCFRGVAETIMVSCCFAM